MLPDAKINLETKPLKVDQKFQGSHTVCHGSGMGKVHFVSILEHPSLQHPPLDQLCCPMAKSLHCCLICTIAIIATTMIATTVNLQFHDDKLRVRYTISSLIMRCGTLARSYGRLAASDKSLAKSAFLQGRDASSKVAASHLGEMLDPYWLYFSINHH